jgi:hypothetical protein
MARAKESLAAKQKQFVEEYPTELNTAQAGQGRGPPGILRFNLTTMDFEQTDRGLYRGSTPMTILLIIIIILLIGGGGGYYAGPFRRGGGPPNNLVGILLAIVVIVILLRLLGVY